MILLIVIFIINAFLPLYPLRIFIVYMMAIAFLVYFFIAIIINSKAKKVTKVLGSFCISLIIVLYSYQAYQMLDDIIKGPKEAIITDISVKSRTTSGKYRRTYHYITGKINGEEVKLKIVKDWSEIMDTALKYKKAEIRYYKNANSIETIEFIK